MNAMMPVISERCPIDISISGAWKITYTDMEITVTRVMWRISTCDIANCSHKFFPPQEFAGIILIRIEDNAVDVDDMTVVIYRTMEERQG